MHYPTQLAHVIFFCITVYSLIPCVLCVYPPYLGLSDFTPTACTHCTTSYTVVYPVVLNANTFTVLLVYCTVSSCR